MLDQIDGEVDIHRPLGRRTDDLSLAHRVMPVAEREQRAGNFHAEIDGVAGADFGTIHVAAEGIGNDRGTHFAAR